MSNHRRLAQALVATGVAIAAVVGPATLAFGQQAEPPAPRGMERMHELMEEGNPGMDRMHSRMGNTGMERMHSRMMSGDVSSSS